MHSSGGVSRIKLKRDLFKVDNTLEPNKRRWTGPKTMSGLNPPADHRVQSGGGPAAADALSSRSGDEHFSLRDSAEHDDGGHAGYNKGTLLSKVTLSDSKGESTPTRGPRTRSQWASSHGKVLKRLCEHKKQICYRLRLALCFAEKKQRRARHARNASRCRALSYINSNVSVKSGNISIKSTVRAEERGETAEQTSPVRGVRGVDSNYVGHTGGADVLGQKRTRSGRPKQVCIHSLGESTSQVKTTIKTEVRRAQTPRACKSTSSGRAPSTFLHTQMCFFVKHSFGSIHSIFLLIEIINLHLCCLLLQISVQKLS